MNRLARLRDHLCPQSKSDTCRSQHVAADLVPGVVHASDEKTDFAPRRYPKHQIMPGTPLDVVIVGAGINGIAAARRLASEGLVVAVLERQESLGGIWASYANVTSRAQNHEPAYRLGTIGYTPAEEDYTTRDQLILELERGALLAGIADRIHCGCEVFRVVDTADETAVQVYYRNLFDQANASVRQLQAREVIFCTGTLQNPRSLTFLGEDVFGGTVVAGLASAANHVDYQGKRVVVIGMGAFAIDNARTALLAGAAQVDIVARNRAMVQTKLFRLMNILATQEYLQSGNPANYLSEQDVGVPLDRGTMWRRAFEACGAKSAKPNRMDQGGTPGTTSDIFFIAYALGRLYVHKGEVSHLEKGTVVMTDAQGTSKQIQADVLIKNVGFDGIELNDQMGGLVEVVGRRTCRTIWITPRVLTFRHETDLPKLSPPEVLQEARNALHSELDALEPHQLKARAVEEGCCLKQLQDACHCHNFKQSVISLIMEEFEQKGRARDTQLAGINFVGSSPFGSIVWLEIYLHFRDKPDELQQLFQKLPRTALSKTTIYDLSQGLSIILASSEVLTEKINVQRRALNDSTFSRYADPTVPPASRQVAWIRGYLKENRADWEEACRQLTGDASAVPYLWADIATKVNAT